jgi:hypothetical protein
MEEKSHEGVASWLNDLARFSLFFYPAGCEPTGFGLEVGEVSTSGETTTGNNITRLCGALHD